MSTNEFAPTVIEVDTLNQYKATWERVVSTGWQTGEQFPVTLKIELPSGSNYKIMITAERTDAPVA